MILKWESADGKIIEFTDRNKYILENRSGFGYPPNDIKSVKSPYQIGSTLIGQVIEPRQIEIEFAVITEDKDLLFQRKREVIKAFNPVQRTGNLTYIDAADNKYQINAVPEQAPSFKEDQGTYQNITLNLHAPDPRWYNPDPVNITLNQSTELINSGDTVTPIEITLEGPMSNPVIINKTAGKKIRLNHSIGSGEKITINTKFGSKSIFLYDSLDRRRKAFSLLSFDSQLFGLKAGSNIISFGASNMNDTSNAVISYKKRYLGI